ncbi:MAG: nucleotide-binding protein [Promethearchaeota archaeon]
MNIQKRPLIISVVGKGGTGKTMITVLLAKVLSQKYDYKMLLIDADPSHPHLSNMVKLTPEKSLEQVRIELVKKSSKKNKNLQKLAENLDFDVYNAMSESKDFCLFSIGQPEGPGCFCPSNTLLRKVIESISKDFDIILIDCEAGLEQIQREVIRSVDILLIITDISLRSVETANSIKKGAKKFTNYKKLGVIINKAKNNIGVIKKRLQKLDLPLLGEVHEDNIITEFDLEGKPLFDIPEDAQSLLEVEEILKKILDS